MEFVIKISQFLMSLSLLIILHELGHFIPAKLFKTRVEKFYLFFDVKFSLLKKKIGETEYGIGWLPLGGYVKISGMVDESMDTEQLKQEPQPWEFRSKPAWQRLIIMLGGVMVNFVLAFLIYIGIAFAWGDLYIKSDAVKDGIWVANPVVEKAGLQTGDRIISVDGVKKEQFHTWNEAILLGKEVQVERNGEQKNIVMPVDFINQLSNGERKSIVELRIPFIVSNVDEASPNVAALQPLDRIIAFNGQPIKYADQVLAQVDTLAGRTVKATIIRKEVQQEIQLKVSDSSRLGVYYANRISPDNIRQLGLYEVTEHSYSFAEAIPIGIARGFDQLGNYGKQLQKIFNPSTGAYKEVGGFKAIFDIFPTAWSWHSFWTITALLSIMLGVMNLLPIPALDGGHVMFLLYEMITGRKPSDKFLENAQMVGFVLLIALLLFANGNDFYKAIFK